jgi:hypothetical protein
MGNSITFSYTETVTRSEGAWESSSLKFSLTMEDDNKFTGQENDYCYSMIDISKKFRSGCVFCPDFPQEMLMKKN